jgi:hypothetical protein
VYKPKPLADFGDSCTMTGDCIKHLECNANKKCDYPESFFAGGHKRGKKSSKRSKKSSKKMKL